MPVRPEYILAAADDSPYYGARRTMAELLGRGRPGDSPQTEELPPGWLVRRWSGWEGWTPRDWTPRVQGWKIHVSSTPECAVETLARVTRICVRSGVCFKFLHEASALVDTNGKQHDRGASGKFVTIYPEDDAQLGLLLTELEDALAGQEGPYILSDLRYADAPVFVRYGGIMSLSFPDAQDRPVAAVTSGPELRLVPDQRQPQFLIPAGVALPDCLQAAYARSRTSLPSRLKDFKAVSSLHFSNAGGVYKATLPDGVVRVLREARSHTGLDARGRDAVTRQREEQAILTDLVGVAGVQQLVGSFWAWEHRYLELEYAPGRSLTAWVVQNSAFEGGPDGIKRARFAEQAVRVGAQLIDIVERVHARGWAVGDLHPGNVLVSDDLVVTLLDLEDATRVGAPRSIGFRVFEFCAPEELDAVEADWYAVARSLMLMYVPDWEQEIVAPGYWDEALARVGRLFGPAALNQIAAVCGRFRPVERHMLAPSVTVGLRAEPLQPREAITALDAGIEWSRQFSDAGSFPGDPTQEGDATESFGAGRAGVVWTRLRLGRPVPDADLDALERAARGEVREPGLYPGRAGLALALADAGRHAAAVAAARSALVESAARRRLDLYGGRAGVVLAAIETACATGDADLLAEALAANERLQRGVVAGTSPWDDLTHRRGYAFGLTGLALTDLVAHCADGSLRPLDRAVDRLRDELAACIVTKDGDLMVRDVDNNRALPYLEWGSAGIWGVAMAAERLSAQRVLTDSQRIAAVRACSSDVYVYNCLDHGRAGIMAILAAGGPETVAEVDRQRTMLLANLLGSDDLALTAGDGFIRLSSDLSTGAAGVALALHCAEGEDPFAWLPVTRETARNLAALPAPVSPRATMTKAVRIVTKDQGITQPVDR